ncbi:MAG TPA: basic amino acid ABC transporter substrate-binding protein [Anaerolineaceae bacterium]|nr:basic amino acid ABC transporter substrate-binding protein [Anaerolineaceae bacterium]
MNRKLFVILSALLALALILTACAPAAQKITVATDATFKPFEYTDDNGNLVGFDIDLMNEIAKKADLQIEWVNIPFESLLSGLATCQYDMAIAGISIDPERQKQMLFSDPYMDAGLVVVVQKNNTTINSKDDLKGLKVSAQLGTTGEIEAKKIEGVTYKPYDTFDLAFLDLANGQIDAVIADNPVALGFIAANPDKLKTAGPVFNSEQYGIAMCKSKTDLQTKVNTALKELVADGTITDLAKKDLAPAGQ